MQDADDDDRIAFDTVVDVMQSRTHAIHSGDHGNFSCMRLASSDRIHLRDQTADINISLPHAPLLYGINANVDKIGVSSFT